MEDGQFPRGCLKFIRGFSGNPALFLRYVVLDCLRGPLSFSSGFHRFLCQGLRAACCSLTMRIRVSKFFDSDPLELCKAWFLGE